MVENLIKNIVSIKDELGTLVGSRGELESLQKKDLSARIRELELKIANLSELTSKRRARDLKLEGEVAEDIRQIKRDVRDLKSKVEGIRETQEKHTNTLKTLKDDVDQLKEHLLPKKTDETPPTGEDVPTEQLAAFGKDLIALLQKHNLSLSGL